MKLTILIFLHQNSYVDYSPTLILTRILKASFICVQKFHRFNSIGIKFTTQIEYWQIESPWSEKTERTFLLPMNNKKNKIKSKKREIWMKKVPFLSWINKIQFSLDLSPKKRNEQKHKSFCLNGEWRKMIELLFYYNCVVEYQMVL